MVKTVREVLDVNNFQSFRRSDLSDMIANNFCNLATMTLKRNIGGPLKFNIKISHSYHTW